MSQRYDDTWAKPYGFARRLIEFWALAGGLLLLAIVLMNAYSLAAGIVINKPLLGDFEMVEVGVAVAAFTFLPYCQLTGANVTADIFTQNASPRVVAALALFSAAIALGFSLLLFWRMSQGLIDYYNYAETTATLGFPIWIAFVPIVASLVLLAIASFISVRDALVEVRTPTGMGAASH